MLIDDLCSTDMRRVKDIAIILIKAVFVGETHLNPQFLHALILGDLVLVTHTFDLFQAINYSAEFPVVDLEEHLHFDLREPHEFIVVFFYPIELVQRNSFLLPQLYHLYSFIVKLNMPQFERVLH